jgi:hypothetical protein
MRVSVVDLRYRMNDVLKALDRNEDVSILYHGKLKGVLKASNQTIANKVSAHPYFNMLAGTGKTVEQEMQALRGGRYLDL